MNGGGLAWAANGRRLAWAAEGGGLDFAKDGGSGLETASAGDSEFNWGTAGGTDCGVAATCDDHGEGRSGDPQREVDVTLQ